MNSLYVTPDDQLNSYVHTIFETIPISDEKLMQIMTETSQDKTLQTIMNLVQQGWPKHKIMVPELAKPFFAVKGEMTICI